MNQPLLTPFEAARLLGLTTRKIDRLVRDGGIPHLELPTGDVRFDACELREWAETFHKPLRESLAAAP